MKLHECFTCHRFVEESDTEKIDGFFYCYMCFDYCDTCGKAFPLNDTEEKECLKCKGNSTDTEEKKEL